MKKIKFSLITLAILVLTAFIPVLQILILTAHGAFLSLFTSDDTNIILLVNGVASLLTLLLFYLSNRLIAKVLSIVGVVLFFVPFLFYATENIISTDKYYILKFLIVGIITGVTLLVVEIIKNKALK